MIKLFEWLKNKRRKIQLMKEYNEIIEKLKAMTKDVKEQHIQEKYVNPSKEWADLQWKKIQIQRELKTLELS
jgi:hypothetical protein